MRSREVGLGRTFVLALDDGESFFPSLSRFCTDHDVRHALLPSFIAGFSEVDIVGACDELDDPRAPVWSRVHLTNVEAFGGGTLAWDPDTESVAPHIHVAVGLKERGAVGHVSHLLDATVGFLAEITVIEVREPALLRVRDPQLYDVPLIRFSD